MLCVKTLKHKITVGKQLENHCNFSASVIAFVTISRCNHVVSKTDSVKLPSHFCCSHFLSDVDFFARIFFLGLNRVVLLGLKFYVSNFKISICDWCNYM